MTRVYEGRSGFAWRRMGSYLSWDRVTRTVSTGRQVAVAVAVTDTLHTRAHVCKHLWLEIVYHTAIGRKEGRKCFI